MGSGNDSNPSLGTFLKNLSTPVSSVISFILVVYGLFKLFADKDAGLLALISLTVGILLLLSICLYYARLCKPEQQDKGQSGFLSLSDAQVKAQAKEKQNRKWIRRLANTGLIMIPILSLSGVADWFYVQNLPPKDIIVLVADFDGVEPKRYRVAKNIRKNLEEATKHYTDVEVKELNQTITEKQSARAIGDQQKASIVIWGDYGVTPINVQVSVHFEVMKPPDYFPELEETAKGKAQTSAIAELNSFNLQTRLFKEMSYLTLFSLGMVQYAKSD